MNGNTETQLVRELSLPLYQGKGWMQFLGVLSIIAGALQALTIIGIVVAWLPIWMGILLYQSASAIDEARESGRKDAMLNSLGRIKTYFTIMGVLTLIWIVLGIIFVLFIGLGVFMSALQMQG